MIKKISMFDRNKVKQIAIRFTLLTSIALAAMACDEKAEQTALVRPVQVEKPTLNSSNISNLVLPASINELYETKLSFRVGGPLIKLNDVIGTHVNKGEIIAKIDQRDFKIAVEATESRYKLAKAEYERYKNLFEQKSVSKSVLDQIETSYTLAKIDYEKAGNAFNDAEIRAPFSGHINHVFVNNFEEVVPGVPIVSLLDISKFEVNAWISVEDAAHINKETNFSCIVKYGKNDIKIPGKLKEIGNKTSLSKQALPITIVINSSGKIKLSAGMVCYLEIQNNSSETGAVFQVSLASIFTKENKTNVWIYNTKANTVSARLVTTGKVTNNGTVEIIKGLTGYETIVSAGVNYLFEGQKVKKMIKNSKSNVGNKL
jgi:RND family efflux transporter MFP subunit